MGIRAVSTCSFVSTDSTPDRYKTQEICDKAVDNDSHDLKLVVD